MLLKKWSGVRVPLLFGSGGYPLSKKRGPYPPKPLAGKIFLQTITPREAQVLEMPERGVGPLLCPDRGVGISCFQKNDRGMGYLPFL